MLKLRTTVIEDLASIIVPSYVGRLVERFEEEVKNNLNPQIEVSSVNTISSIPITIRLNSAHFTEVELKPYTWYSREQFDGNPKGYLTLEYSEEIDNYLCLSSAHTILFNSTDYFMYIESMENDDE